MVRSGGALFPVVALVRSLQTFQGVMARLIVHRRRDGIVQLRRQRIWHVISARELAAILLLFLTSVAFSLALVAAVSLPSLLLALAPVAPVAAVAVWAARAANAPAFVIAPVDDPPRPPRRVA